MRWAPAALRAAPAGAWPPDDHLIATQSSRSFWAGSLRPASPAPVPFFPIRALRLSRSITWTTLIFTPWPQANHFPLAPQHTPYPRVTTP